MPPVAVRFPFDSPPSPRRIAPSRTARIASHDVTLAPAVPAADFDAMEAAYWRSGGIVSGDELALMLRCCSEQPLSRLARWIVAREVVSFDRHGTTWLPLFQFERASMSLRPEVAAIVEELVDVFDDGELAAWFVVPNAWLHGGTPIDALAECPSDVREAARADRFIARG
ncbi:MAG TPA: hypothetical protein VF169_05160 [Albitalea sp.]|uniref:hypothetical protein n=1 Tax=Piscinibacter sp. TaxID=1903157 RepID=UPI002ED66F8A